MNHIADNPQIPPKIEKTIGKTTYIMTSHFQPHGPTAEQAIQRLINQDTQSEDG